MSEINNLLNSISNIKIDIKEAIINKGQTVTNFASYPNAILNIITENKKAKLFTSLEEMQADPNPTEGDIAVVYGVREILLSQDKLPVQSLILPATVVLNEPVTKNYSLYGGPSSGSGCNLEIQLTASSCILKNQQTNKEYARYTSSDGITYNILGGSDVTVNFGSSSSNNLGTLYSGYLDNLICLNFTYVEYTKIFLGAFIYINNQYIQAPSQINALPENVYDNQAKFIGLNGIYNGSLNYTYNLNTEKLRDRINLYSKISNIKLNDTDASNIFKNMYSLNTLYDIPNINLDLAENIDYIFYNCSNLKELPNYNFDNVKSANYAFAHLYNILSFPNYNFNNVINGSHMFEGIQADISHLSFNNIEDASNMFSSIKLDDNHHLPQISSNNITNAAAMFYSCNIKHIPAINYSNIINANQLFGYSNLDSISDLNLSKAENTSSILNSCNKLLNINNIDFSNTKNAQSSFYYCYNLTSATNINIINAQNVYSFFSSCSNLTNISNLTTSKINDMGDMFGYCNKLTEIPDIYVENLKSISLAFHNCQNLLNIPNIIGTNKLKDIRGAFWQCSNIKVIPEFDTSEVTRFDVLCSECHNLITSANYNMSNAINIQNMFNNCSNLKDVPQFDLNGNITYTNRQRPFMYCNNLSTASIHNIINSYLNAGFTSYKNFNNTNAYSPFYGTNITSSKYSNRLTEITSAGWTY